MSGNRTEERIPVNEGLPAGNASQHRTGREIQTLVNQQEKSGCLNVAHHPLKMLPPRKPHREPYRLKSPATFSNLSRETARCTVLSVGP